MQVNLEKTALQNLIDLIISTNEGTDLTENQFNFLDPVVLDVVEDDLNTSIKLVAVPGEGYVSDVTFRYTRLTLDSNLPQPLENVHVEEEIADDVFGHVVSILGILPSEVELVSCTLPVVNDDIGIDVDYGNITIKAKEDSLIYFGTYSVVLVPEADPDLSKVFAITDLDGFTTPKNKLT